MIIKNTGQITSGLCIDENCSVNASIIAGICYKKQQFFNATFPLHLGDKRNKGDFDYMYRRF